tara:strand:- start:301 stop:549 length:249 start_codon:yes stop_codon:yes gene_type:complete
MIEEDLSAEVFAGEYLEDWERIGFVKYGVIYNRDPSMFLVVNKRTLTLFNNCRLQIKENKNTITINDVSSSDVEELISMFKK